MFSSILFPLSNDCENVMIYKFKKEQLKAFLKKTEGAVTADFVVITAAAVIIATALVSALGEKVISMLASIIL